MKSQSFQFGNWHVNPNDNSISDGNDSRQMEPRAMDVLVTLCSAPNTIFSAEELLEKCWGSALYGDNPVHKIIAQLRRLLGDQSSAPQYIETIRKRGYRTIAPVQIDASEQAQAGLWHNESPFRGLQAFDEQHAPVFFGRSDAIFRLGAVVAQQIFDPAAVELVLVLGPSGSGKTSLVRAGLLPYLMQKSDSVHIVSHSGFDLAEKGEHSLLLTLAGMLLDLEVGQAPVFTNHSASSLCQILETEPEALYQTLQLSLQSGPQSNQQSSPPISPQISMATLPVGKPLRHALFIDRFEAVFDDKQVSNEARNGFLRVLDQLARTHALLIILACRNDFYPQLAAYPLLMAGKQHGAHFDLNPPSQAELAQMIRLPALAAGLSFGIDEQTRLHLDDVLCEGATGNPDALPLLQYTLHELYRLRTPDNELSFAAFAELGGIEGAIGQRAEQVMSALSVAQQLCLPQVLSLVATISSQDAPVTSRRAGWAGLRSDDERAVVNALVESRLFVSELVDGARGFGVAHEALLRRWPRVVAWVASHRAALQIRNRIGEMAQRWQRDGKSQDLLIPEGKQLDEARGLLGLSGFSLSAVETALVAASMRRTRWRKRLRGAALAMIILLAVLATGLGLSAMSAQKQAQRQRTEVEGLMGFMLGDFTEKLRPLARLDLLDSVGDRALAYFKRAGNEDLSETALTQRAKALQVLAEVRYTRGDAKTAEDALQTAALILLRQQKKTPNNHEVLKNLGVNAFWLGQIRLDKREWQQATVFFTQYQQYSDRLHQLDPNNPEWWIEQSYAHNNLGTVALNLRDFKRADSEFQQSLALKNRALGKKPQDNTLQAELADSLSWSATMKAALGELDAAMQLHQKEAAIVQKLAATHPGDGLWRARWAISLQHQAELHKALGDDATALGMWRHAAQLYEINLKHESDNQTWQRNLVLVQLGIDQLLARHAPPQTQFADLIELKKATASLIRRNPGQPALIWADAILERRIGNKLTNQHNLTDSKPVISGAIHALEQLFSANPTDLETKLLLIDTLLTEAEWASQAQGPAEVQRACARGRAVLARDVENSLDYRVLDRWLRLHLCLNARDEVRATHARLTKIGYRDSEYLKLISQFK
jgi:DNA-binding winged helix-turn-helix (wHTH) protein/tetratricopeptide (TPR) repeat protein/energy-coupling factor transporter ATP-binding protein EcfA2